MTPRSRSTWCESYLVGCARLCAAVRGCARLCAAVRGCAMGRGCHMRRCADADSVRAAAPLLWLLSLRLHPTLHPLLAAERCGGTRVGVARDSAHL